MDGEERNEGVCEKEIRLTGRMGVICIMWLCGQTKHVLGNFAQQPFPVLWQFSTGFSSLALAHAPLLLVSQPNNTQALS